MFDSHRPHVLLTQVPLTLSPYLSIPTAVTLPYTFRSALSSLPPSMVADDKAKYVRASSGHAAHPDDIIVSCRVLQEHINKTHDSDKSLVDEWEASIKARDLAAKRRVAPGWLDRDEKILEPKRADSKREDLLGEQPGEVSAPVMSPAREGEELDRLFGNMAVKK